MFTLLHLRPGVFFGHPRGLEAQPASRRLVLTVGEVPSGLTWPEAMQRVKRLQPPAVWFPYKKAGQSATDIVCDLSDEFGPFSGQLFVGEFPTIRGFAGRGSRKSMVKYQGAVSLSVGIRLRVFSGCA
ncbi:MAG: hypothetical protein R3B96_18750 [Pirellulaceae bacterium]